jgi:hypothetical protein
MVGRNMADLTLAAKWLLEGARVRRLAVRNVEYYMRALYIINATTNKPAAFSPDDLLAEDWAKAPKQELAREWGS